MATPISDDEKRAAVERVLQSRLFGRAEQLRKLFAYVCEAEITGRGRELNEQELGVQVLGRPPGYSPTKDSAVRSRVYELRQRLQSHYDAEGAHDPVRIEIERGGYCPRFERTTAAGASEARLARHDAPRLTPELDALWGPLLAGRAPLLIVFEVRLFFYAPAAGLVVRDHRTDEPSQLDASQPLLAFRERMAASELRETRDYADFGAVHAAFLLGRLLSTRAVDVGLKHASSLDWQDLWNSHVVFIGKPYHPIVRSLLADKSFPVDDEGVIHNPHPIGDEAPEYRNAETHGSGDKHALITRLRSPQPGRYLLLLTSVAAELMWALAECVTNPVHAAHVLSPLRTPSGEYPDELQIVVRATFRANVPVEIRYVTHRVLPTG